MSLPADALEGKYEVVHKIREGGMGAVYKVRHVLLEEERVIKVIRSQLADSEELRERFQREARTAIQLRHPKIAEIYDFSVGADGTAYIVMELIDGKTIRDILRDGGPPTLDLSIEIAIQMLEALGFLHRKGYLHRDVAPDNAMLTRDFEGLPLVKLIDLGIAKRLGADDGALTSTGMFVGKARYSSPEQFSQKGVDPRSDLYSFGVLLYEMLTGSSPIVGTTLSQLIAGHLFHPPQDFNQTDPEGRVPLELRQVVTRALAKDPDQRISSAEEFIRLLRPSQQAIVQADSSELEETLLFARAEALDPSSSSEVSSLISTAQLLIGQSKFTDARRELQQALVLNPGNSEASRMLAMVEEVLRHQAEADRQGVMTGLAKQIEEFIDGGDPDTAGEKLAEAVTLYGSGELFQELQTRLERILAEREEERLRNTKREQSVRERIDLARSALQEALKLDPSNQEARQLLDEAKAPPDSLVTKPLVTESSLPEPLPTKPKAAEVDIRPKGETAAWPRWVGAAAIVFLVGFFALMMSRREPEVTGTPTNLPVPLPPVASPMPEPDPVRSEKAPAETARPETTPADTSLVLKRTTTPKPSPTFETPSSAKPPPPPPPRVPQPPAPRTKPPLHARVTKHPAIELKAGPGVVAPKLLQVPTPIYPARAKGSAKVIVAVHVDEFGKVDEVKIHQPAIIDLGFDASALEAARQATFDPATKNGIPGKMWTGLAFDFAPES